MTDTSYNGYDWAQRSKILRAYEFEWTMVLSAAAAISTWVAE